MIISHKYKFIFIKTRKTAGTSIEVFLSKFCGENDVLTPVWPHIEPHRARNYKGFWNPLPEIHAKTRSTMSTIGRVIGRKRYSNHMPASTVKLRTSKNIWNSYFKFCVERNPWDKTLSHYHMLKDRSDEELTLDQYIEQKNFCMNLTKYTDSNEKLLVDQVVKYESLTDDLGSIFQTLGIPFDGSLGVRAKSEHRKDRTPYQEVFTDKQRDAIQKSFAKEIQMHGYTY